MYLIRRWNEIMGPKDERLEEAEGKAAKVTACILFVGATLCLYYEIMLNQVAYTTGNPILTELGQSVVSVQVPLLLTVLAAGMASDGLRSKSGFFSSRKRFAEVSRIPWGFVTVSALSCGALIGALTCGMRILAEIQIVGVGNVAWFGDIAIGIVVFAMGFAVGFVLITLNIRSAIKRRREMELGLEG